MFTSTYNVTVAIDTLNILSALNYLKIICNAGDSKNEKITLARKGGAIFKYQDKSSDIHLPLLFSMSSLQDCVVGWLVVSRIYVALAVFQHQVKNGMVFFGN